MWFRFSLIPFTTGTSKILPRFYSNKRLSMQKSLQNNDTVKRILQSATFLFAERGFSETSVRTITGLADVNLASVNYHFGSKKDLIQAVFSRFLNPIARDLDSFLNHTENSDTSTEDLLRGLFRVILEAAREVDEKPQRFMQLLGLAYSQSQEHLRHFLLTRYGKTYQRFLKALAARLSGIESKELFWRLHFMLGAAIFTLSSFDSIRSILNAEYQDDTHLDEAIELLVPSLVSMLESP